MITNPTFAHFSGQGMISFSYDDIVVENALELHNRYNVPAAFSLITKKVHDDYVYAGRVKAVSDMGFEIGSHSHTHPNDVGNYFQDLPLDNAEQEFETSVEVLRAAGIPRIESFTVPGSKWKYKYIAAAQKYFKLIRGLDGRASIYEECETDAAYIIPYPPYDPWDMPSYCIVGQDTLDQVIVEVDRAIEQKGWRIFMLHKISKNPADQGHTYIWDYRKLEALLLYVNSKSKDQLLPINLQDGLRFASGLGDYVSSKISLRATGSKIIATGYDDRGTEVPVARGFRPKWSVVEGDLSIGDNNDGSVKVSGAMGKVRCEDAGDASVHAEIEVKL